MATTVATGALFYVLRIVFYQHRTVLLGLRIRHAYSARAFVRARPRAGAVHHRVSGREHPGSDPGHGGERAGSPGVLVLIRGAAVASLVSFSTASLLGYRIIHVRLHL